MEQAKIIKAKISFARHSPRKVRVVAKAIAGMEPEKAVAYLRTLPQSAAKVLLEVFLQGLGNAKTNFQVSPGDLQVKTLQVLGGPRGPKKADVHAHGARFDRGVRRKRLSHIILELVSKEK